MNEAFPLPRLLPREPDSHKGTYGRVLVIAGSRSMPGAAVLATLGALRGGAGLATLATGESALAMIASAAPCATFLPLQETRDGWIDATAFDRLLPRIEAADVVVLGPGLGTEPNTQALIRRLITAVRTPLVLDADGLNAVAADPKPLLERSGVTVLTPHPGELSRLDGEPPPRDREARRTRAEHAARRFRSVVCLKGHRTVVTDGTSWRENTTGNPSMATGGAGDVLSGVMGALLHVFERPLDAAACAVHVHGLAGDFAAYQHGPVSVIATDLLDHLGAAFQHYARHA
jgi:NAD(P)H-hydrate epimerase